MSTWKMLSAAAAVMLMTLVSAQAAPMTSATETVKAQAAQAAQTSSEVTRVQWGNRGYYRGGYGRYGYGYGRGYRRGPYIGLGIGAGIVAGAIIADSYYRPRPATTTTTMPIPGRLRPAQYAGDPRVLCAESFRSFEWRTGLYTTYGGEKRLCPYLQ